MTAGDVRKAEPKQTEEAMVALWWPQLSSFTARTANHGVEIDGCQLVSIDLQTTQHKAVTNFADPAHKGCGGEWATVTHLTVHCGRTHRQHGGNKDKATHDVGQKQASEPATSLSFVHNMSHFKRSKSRYKRSGGYQTHLYCS
jgi:hypothetical protein